MAGDTPIPCCPRAGCKYRGRWHELDERDGPKAPTGSAAQFAPAIYFLGPEDKVRGGPSPCAHAALANARLIFSARSQLCRTCNSMLYNISGGSNSQTVELSPDIRARLDGIDRVRAYVDGEALALHVLSASKRCMHTVVAFKNIPRSLRNVPNSHSMRS